MEKPTGKECIRARPGPAGEADVFTKPAKVGFGFLRSKPEEQTGKQSKLAKLKARRVAQLAEASEVVNVLPEPGESLHCLMTGRYDLMHVILAIIGKVGPVDHLRIATLSFNGPNVDEMRELLDSGRVTRLTLLASKFFMENSRPIWALCEEAFEGKQAALAAARNHCKVVCFDFRDGRRLILEGSANLRTNSNVEQLAIINDAGLFDFHAEWIDEAVKNAKVNECCSATKGCGNP